MNQPKKVTITQALTILAAAVDVQLTAQRLEIYVESLADLPLQSLLAAIGAIKETHEYPNMPTVGAIRAKAADLEMARQGIPSSMEAWNQVSRGPRTDAHPLAAEAFRQLGGWDAFGRSNVDQEASWRARFDQAFTTLVTRYRHDQLLLSEGTREAAGLLPAGEQGQQKVSSSIQQLMTGMKV